LKPEIDTGQQLLREEEVIEKARGNPADFKPLYEKYFKPIFLFVLHRVGDKELSADLTSQVFLKALQKLNQYESRGFPFSSWLFRIAVNECNDFFRKSKRNRIVVLDDSHAETLYEEMFGAERMEELKAKLPYILERLSEDELQVIQLRFMEERPFKEIAEILEISENYAKVKTYRVLDKMKTLFAGR
jgi:RNA polymerase sigma-70 factor (ECF subfamily)